MSETATPHIKVSVLVATYRSGPELQGLVDSLDRQSLPTDEWEAIFVDDGSPDDTLARLEEIARTRPNFRVTQIENSGWPCRPRNIGIDLAQGDYVAFLDHDDQLYPDALRDGYDYAAEHRADILNGKEARTHDMAWALRRYKVNTPQEIGHKPTTGAILPTNPHKLYRRAFLNEHGIRFREEGRVLWEDVFFNVDALRHAEVVSTLATTPFYYWNTTEGSGSTTFLRKNQDWWDWFTEVVQYCDSLDPARLGPERDSLRRHQYRSRLIDAFYSSFPKRPDAERRMIFDRAREIQQQYYSPDDDRHLNVRGRLRADLLRRGEFDAMSALGRADQMPQGVPSVTAARWKDGIVELEFASRWRPARGKRLAIRAEGETFVKDLPAELAAQFAPEQLDMTAEVAAASALPALRSRTTRVSWPIWDSQSTSHATVSADGAVTLDVTGNARIDATVTAAGTPLPRDIWEVSIASSFAGSGGQPMVRSIIRPSVRVDADGIAAIFSNKSRTIVIDYDQRANPISSVLVPTGVVRTEGRTVVFEVTIDEIAADGEFATTVDVNTESALKTLLRAPLTFLRRKRGRNEGGRGWNRVPATLRVRDGRAEIVVASTSGGYLVRLGHFDRTSAQVYRVGRGSLRALRGRLRSLIA